MRPLKIALITVVGLLCGAGAILAYTAATHGALSLWGSTGIQVPGAASLAAPAPAFSDTVAAPDRLIIPAIGVDAHVKAVGVDANGDLATPGDATDVAWYEKGPEPGQTGSAVIDGHLETKTVAQAVFYKLDELKTGDEVRVRDASGKEMVFKVTAVKQYAENASTQDIFLSSDGASHLNLITCSGDWVPEKHIYNQRLVVFTERVS